MPSPFPFETDPLGWSGGSNRAAACGPGYRVRVRFRVGSRIQRSGPQRTRPYNRRYSGLGDTSVLPSQVLPTMAGARLALRPLVKRWFEGLLSSSTPLPRPTPKSTEQTPENFAGSPQWDRQALRSTPRSAPRVPQVPAHQHRGAGRRICCSSHLCDLGAHPLLNASHSVGILGLSLPFLCRLRSFRPWGMRWTAALICARPFCVFALLMHCLLVVPVKALPTLCTRRLHHAPTAYNF